MTITTFGIDEIKEITNEIASNKSCQLRTITSELLSNLNRWLSETPNNFADKDKDYLIDQIRDLISSLRDCHPSNLYGLLYGIDLNSEEFINNNDLSDEEKEDIKYTYENLWHHNSIIGLLNSGKIKGYNYKVLEVEKVEYAAFLYSSQDYLKSATLEYLLIDSLVFAETVAFAQEIKDFPIPEYWPALRHITWVMTKFMIKESFALILTAFVSNIAGNSESFNFWILFSSITIIRWLNPLRIQRINLQDKPKFLLADMISFYDSKLKNSQFNPKLVREMLYELEKKGASYSYAVYNILDRIIKQQNISKTTFKL